MATKNVFFLKLLWHIESKLGCTDNCFLTMAKQATHKAVPIFLKHVLKEHR